MKMTLNTKHPLVSGGSIEYIEPNGLILSGDLDEIEIKLKGYPGAPDGSDTNVYRYLTFRVYNHQPTVERLFVRFWEQGADKARIQLDVALMANMDALVVFDMEDLKAQRSFLPLQPGSLKSHAAGDSTSIDNVDRMSFGLGHGYINSRKLVIFEAYWTDNKPDYIVSTD